jgi:hypothetical protein
MNFTTIEDQEIMKGEIILSWDEVAEMIAIKAILFKFLNKSKLSYQISLWLGHERGKENEAYAKIEVMEELKKAIESLEETLISFNTKKGEQK